MFIVRRLRHSTITVAATIAASVAVAMSGATTASAAPNLPVINTQYNPAWSGLVHEGNATSVGSVFTVPHLQCPLNPPFYEVEYGFPEAVQWIGLGGVSDLFGSSGSPLVQAGIDNQCGTLGAQASYLTWQELPGNSSKQDLYNYPALPGDTISVSIDYKGGISFGISVTDLGPGEIWNWSKTTQEPAEHGVPQSAEWIVEAPTNAVIPALYYAGAPLANFGTVHFSLCSFASGTSGGHFLTNADKPVKYVAVSLFGPETAVSGLSSLATFTVQYRHS